MKSKKMNPACSRHNQWQRKWRTNWWRT